MERMIEKASDKDPFFVSSYEKKFLDAILLAFRNNDMTSFAEAV